MNWHEIVIQASLTVITIFFIVFTLYLTIGILTIFFHILTLRTLLKKFRQAGKRNKFFSLNRILSGKLVGNLVVFIRELFRYRWIKYLAFFAAGYSVISLLLIIFVDDLAFNLEKPEWYQIFTLFFVTGDGLIEKILTVISLPLSLLLSVILHVSFKPSNHIHVLRTGEIIDNYDLYDLNLVSLKRKNELDEFEYSQRKNFLKSHGGHIPIMFDVKREFFLKLNFISSIFLRLILAYFVVGIAVFAFGYFMYAFYPGFYYYDFYHHFNGATTLQSGAFYVILMWFILFSVAQIWTFSRDEIRKNNILNILLWLGATVFGLTTLNNMINAAIHLYHISFIWFCSTSFLNAVFSALTLYFIYVFTLRKKFIYKYDELFKEIAAQNLD